MNVDFLIYVFGSYPQMGRIIEGFQAREAINEICLGNIMHTRDNKNYLKNYFKRLRQEFSHSLEGIVRFHVRG